MRAGARAWVRASAGIAVAVLTTAGGASAADDAATTISAQTGPKSTPATMFPKGTWTLQLHGAYFHSIIDDEEIFNGVASGGYYFDDKHVFRLELLGYHLDEENGTSDDADDASAAGVNVGLRYHYLEYERLSLFIEGIAGLFYGTRNWPEGGTHFNFNQQMGLGATFRFDEHAHLIGGVRYMHLSNGRIRGEDENPSFDGIGGYVGVMFTY